MKKKNVHMVTAYVATVAFCAPAASAADKNKRAPSQVVKTSTAAGASNQATTTANANNQTTTTQKTPKTKAPQLKARDLKASKTELDHQLARVKTQMSEIQASTLPREEKIKKQRALLDSEVVRAKEQMREIQADSKDSKESKDASRDRRKASLDNLQKFLDIVRSMNPLI
jgi:hypothetical protein